MLEYYYIHFDVNTYADNCTQNIKRVYTKLDKYLENPTKDNIHHMRTSLRRLKRPTSQVLNKFEKKRKSKSLRVWEKDCSELIAIYEILI